MQPGNPAPAQLRPELLAPGEAWHRWCLTCEAIIQGGRGGLEAHNVTVHPEEK
jgi:hypothetical protein